MKSSYCTSLVAGMLLFLTLGAESLRAQSVYSDAAPRPPGYESSLSVSSADFNVELSDNEYYEIDVLFLYTPEVLSLRSGLNGVQSEIDKIVAVANRVFQNSTLPIFVKSVGLEQTPILESNDMDGELHLAEENDAVRSMRESHAADVVATLVSHNSNDQDCGRGFLLDKMDEFSNNFGYLYTSLHSGCEDWVFTHELGHVLGAEHDKENVPAGKGLYTNSFGIKFQIGGVTYRTVMAFAPGTVIEYFSSPELSYQGVPLGSSEADNVSTIRQSMSFVAAYRGGSTITLSPEISLSTQNSKKKCVLAVTLNHSPSSSVLEIRQKSKNGLPKTLKSFNSFASPTSVTFKRSKTSKKLFAVLSTADGEIESETVTCPKKR